MCQTFQMVNQEWRVSHGCHKVAKFVMRNTLNKYMLTHRDPPGLETVTIATGIGGRLGGE
jgi:hypothetical protein